MATGGIFQLITNDGKQDRMLMASELLRDRIKAATTARSARGEADTTPTLYDIERTHIVFTNAHFKPFAAIGYEYNKVSVSGASLGSQVVFSIPQFGDFFNDMIVHAIIDQPVLKAVTDTSKQNLFRWCAYPGERLLKKVKFDVNGNPLDEYTTVATNFHREFTVQPNKELAWNRCVGQEEPQNGYLDQPTWVNNGVAAADIKYRAHVNSTSGFQTPTGTKTDKLELFIPLLFWCNKDPRLSIPSVAIPYGQRFITIDLAKASELVGEVGRGYATAADAWTQATIDAGGVFEKQAVLSTIELYINNIFVNPEVHNIFIKRIGFTLIRVHRMQESAQASDTTDKVLLQNLKWPIEALFVGMRYKDYGSASDDIKTRQNLDKWHSFCSVTQEQRTMQGWTSGKKTTQTGLTVAALVAGSSATEVVLAVAPSLHASFSLTGSGTGNYSSLKPGDVITYRSVLGVTVGPLTVNRVGVIGIANTIVFNELAAAVTGFVVGNSILAAQPATNVSLTSASSDTGLTYTTQVEIPTLSSIAIQAHGIYIYQAFPTGFYNSYLPYNYGGNNIKAPRDIGALMVTFCLYPGTYQPSGHINISRAREFYIEYTTNPAVRATLLNNGGTLTVLASAINFLLISDGSAVLRYST